MIDFTRRDTFDRLAVLTGLYSPDASLIESRGAAPVSVRGSKENRIFAAHPGQLKIIDAFFNGERMVQAVCGARWGKTRLAAQFAVYGFMQAHKNIWIVAPTFMLGRKTFGYILEILEKIPWLNGQYKVNRTDWKIMSKQKAWGSFIQLKSASHEYSLDAEELDLVIPDEFAKCKEKTWNRIRPRLMDREGQTFAISTPIGHNFFYNFYESDRWWSVQSSSYENPFLPDGEIDELKKDMDAQAFKQEIMALFVVFAGQVYFMFDPAKHLIKPEDIDLTGWTITCVVDPGLNDPCAVTWFAHNPMTKRDVIIRSMRKSNMLFPEVAKIVKIHEPKHGYDGLVYDPWGGDARSQETSHSFKSWMRDNAGLRFEAKRMGKRERILLARARFENIDGEVNMQILDVPETRSITRAVENYHYPEDSDKQADPVHDINSHECDNIANYVAWRYRRVKTRSQAV